MMNPIVQLIVGVTTNDTFMHHQGKSIGTTFINHTSSLLINIFTIPCENTLVEKSGES